MADSESFYFYLQMVCAIKCALEEVKVYVNDKIDKETAVKLLASKDDKLKAVIILT